MRRGTRALARLAATSAASVLLAVTSMLLALTSAGVFATSSGAWTVAIPVGGIALRLNAVGLVRLATLPGVLHLLDGRSFDTRHGTLAFSREGLALRVHCTPCRLQHPELAASAVQIRSIALEVRRNDDEVHGTLTVDRVIVPFTGRLRAEGVELAWTLPSTEFASLYAALRDAVPEAAFARIEGRIQAQGTLSLPSHRASVNWSATGLEVGSLGTERLQYGWFRHACTQRDGTPRLLITGDGEKSWAAADALGPYLAAAVLAAEDQRFRQHAGYDEQVIAEILADVENGRPKRGGSTITQQLARTLFTGGDRTAVRKLRELLYAIEMERTLGKARILELYLNTVDWGPGVCGARAAARTYFNKSPSRLTAIEAAWLAGVLRNPHAAWEAQVEPRQPDRTRATQVLMQMRDWPKRERQRWTAQPLAFAAPASPKHGERAAPSVMARDTVTRSVQATR